MTKLGQDAAKFLYAKELEWLDRAERRKRKAATRLPERPRSEREECMASLARTSDEEFEKLLRELNDRAAAGLGCGGGTPGVPVIGVDPSGRVEPPPSSGAETP